MVCTFPIMYIILESNKKFAFKNARKYLNYYGTQAAHFFPKNPYILHGRHCEFFLLLTAKRQGEIYLYLKNSTVSICRWHDSTYRKPYTKDSTKKWLELKNKFSKHAGHKTNIQKSSCVSIHLTTIRKRN